MEGYIGLILLVIGLLSCICCCNCGMFCFFGPMALYFSSLAFSVFVPVLYGRSLFRTFGNTGPRVLLLAPAVTLLTLVFVDGSALLSLVFFTHVQPFLDKFTMTWDVTTNTGDLIHQVSTRGLISREFLFVIDVLLPTGTPQWLEILISAGMKTLAMVPFVLAARGFKTRTIGEGEEQPAFKAYFHAQAFPDLREVVRLCVADLVWVETKAAKYIAIAGVPPWGCLTWPLVVMLLLALLAPLFSGAATLALLIVLHGLSLGVIWLAAMGGSGVLLLAERAILMVRSGYAKCPHTECHEPVPLPVYLCPACRTRHDRLIPGMFGVLSRRCRCGNARLPTLFWFGKGRLDAECPHCGGEMHEKLFGSNVHLPIYGGPSTGKTMFMTAAAWQLIESDLPDTTCSLITDQARKRYEAVWKPDFESGNLRDKTSAAILDPAAFLLSIRRSDGLPASLYLYDPSGETFQNQSDVERHAFLEYADGVALVLDPLALDSFAQRYRERGGPDLSQSTSHMDPVDVIDPVVAAMEARAGLSRAAASRTRLAVILAKADIPFFEEEFGLQLGDRIPQGRWADMGATQSRTIRTWLRRHEPHLVQTLETRFEDVRYFAVSATGHMPDGRAGFRPKQVLQPLFWLLSTRTVLSRPLLSWFASLLLEIVVALSVLFVLLVLPSCALGTAFLYLAWYEISHG